jgi:hypothetical protein
MRFYNGVRSKRIGCWESEMADRACAVNMAARIGEDRRRGVAHLDSVPLDEVLFDVPTDKND